MLPPGSHCKSNPILSYSGEKNTASKGFLLDAVEIYNIESGDMRFDP
jgi:hypothetical protein